MALRTGYLFQLASAMKPTQKNEMNQGNISGLTGLSGGLGLALGRFDLGYAFTPMGELGVNQSLSLSAKFE